MYPPGDLDLLLLTSPHMSVMRVMVLHLCTKFEVCWPSSSEDMAHFPSQH